MNAPAGAGRAAPSRAPLAVLAAVGAATAWAALAWGHPAATAAPVLVAVAVWAAWTAPLRVSAGTLAFLVLALDDADTSNGLWHTPLSPLGDLLHHSLRTLVPAARGVALTGTELAAALLLGVVAWRRSRRAGEGGFASPRPVVAIVLAYLGALALCVAGGVARGGSLEVAIWQTRPLIETGVLFFLFDAALRGPADHLLVGRVVVLAAVARALLATWIRYAVAPHATIPVEYATDHGDSMLLALACLALLAHALERPDGRRLRRAALLLPVLLLGIEANARRTAWLELGVGALVFLAVARGARWRRVAGRALLAALPLLVLYGAAGWSSEAAAFRPVQVVRSVVDSSVDRSTWDRQVENWNLAMSLRAQPLAGLGFGREWTEFMVGDDIAAIFLRYHAQPHNQVLGLLLFAGALAFAAIWAPFALLILLGARAHARARAPEDRAAALWVASSAGVLAVQCYADLGPFWPQYAMLAALALAVAGKLAAATGALR